MLELLLYAGIQKKLIIFPNWRGHFQNNQTDDPGFWVNSESNISSLVKIWNFDYIIFNKDEEYELSFPYKIVTNKSLHFNLIEYDEWVEETSKFHLGRLQNYIELKSYKLENGSTKDSAQKLGRPTFVGFMEHQRHSRINKPRCLFRNRRLQKLPCIIQVARTKWNSSKQVRPIHTIMANRGKKIK